MKQHVMSYPMMACAALLLAGGFSTIAAAGQRKTVTPVTPSLLRCEDAALRAQQIAELRAALQKAVRELPSERSTSEDIEAVILYVMSQRDLCPGVGRAALDGLGSGSGAFAQAVARVRQSLLGGGTGTGALTGGSFGNGNGNSLFTAPVIGIGGGSATYSQ